MKGYDQEPEATVHATDAEGWLHTGDLAIMREDGQCHIRGRAKEMIIRGGENIYPAEIENFLYSHPKIAEVQVVGLPDLKLGEIVIAWVAAARRDGNPGRDPAVLRWEDCAF
jgi:fatty-acyl-CoA synthase